MTLDEELALRFKLGINVAQKQEYDDNNYFTASYISEIMGKEVEWSSYQVELFGEVVEAINALKPSNSLNYVTGKELPSEEEIENLKEKDEFKHYPEIIDVCKECLKLNINLKDCVDIINGQSIY